MDAVRNLSVKQLKAALVAKRVTFPIKASKASLLELYQQECVRVTQPGAAIVPGNAQGMTRGWLKTRKEAPLQCTAVAG